MSAEVVALGGGILFLMVAIVGGGFVIRDLSLPRVPHWARAAAGVFGVLLLLPFTLSVFTRDGTDNAVGAPNGRVEHQSPDVRTGIEIDTEPTTTDDEITLTGLAASVRNDPARTGDTITVTYSLTNAGKQPIPLDFTFVGARNPANAHKDAEDMNESRMLDPGETIKAEGAVFLDSAGTWTLWPCYDIQDGRSCPDKWKAFSLKVAE